MSRLFVYAILLVCLFYVFEATAFPQEAETSSQSDFEKIGERAKDLLAKAQTSIGKQLDDIMKNPTVSDFVEESKKFVQKVSDTVRQQAEKLNDK